MSRRTREAQRLRKLERIADIVAFEKRAALARAQADEARIARSVAELDGQKHRTLQAMSADGESLGPAGLTASAQWLRWAEQERRRHMIALASAGAKRAEIQKVAARSIARHSTLARLAAKPK